MSLCSSLMEKEETESILFTISLVVSPAKALQVSGVLEMSSSEPMESECSAEGLLRGGKGEISLSLASWARVSRRRRRFRLLVGVVRERRDTAFFIAGLSDWVTKQGDERAWYVKYNHLIFQDRV